MFLKFGYLVKSKKNISIKILMKWSDDVKEDEMAKYGWILKREIVPLRVFFNV